MDYVTLLSKILWPVHPWTKHSPVNMSTQPGMPGPTASRKRKAAIDDNGEPVTLVKKKIVGPRVTKKKKLDMTTASTTRAPQKPIPVKPRVTRQPSVKDVFDERDKPPSLPPRNSRHILELTDGEEDDDDDPPPPAMDVEDDDDDDEDDVPEEGEEDAEAELGMTPL